MLTKKTINGKEFTFVSEYWETSNAWGHVCDLYLDDYKISHAKARYYNRTWERYTYQSVMERAVYTLIEEYKEKAVERWKSENNKKRITKEQREQVYNDDKNVALYKELYESLS